MTNETVNDIDQQEDLRALADDYIKAWSATDANTRNDLVAEVYAEDAEFFSSEDGDLRLQGRTDIAENIGHVNERDIQGRGLAIKHMGTFVNHRVAKVTWQMVTNDGGVALAGMNVIVLNSSGKIAQDFIFIG
ncbi:nuclear transport factor 2 family protein [Acidithrix ferrooxidans]|uniref:SnoaL-like domain protein n=1 Tax=Acidithrix ferrooxidans TaxID=1280514 RepID=A0A0D8HLK3_9ACTN|nr:nuclear transport factor 2 family protein [Acidithrix ferrooxidans]KJF18627.1 hypothetical protein AXFE_04650 [Acidithrix ferrooxidans]